MTTEDRLAEIKKKRWVSWLDAYPDINWLISEVERLRGCMDKAGFISFMKTGEPEEIADHLNRVAKSWLDYGRKCEAKIRDLRLQLDGAKETVDLQAKEIDELREMLQFAMSERNKLKDELAKLREENEKLKLPLLPSRKPFIIPEPQEGE